MPWKSYVAGRIPGPNTVISGELPSSPLVERTDRYGFPDTFALSVRKPCWSKVLNQILDLICPYWHSTLPAKIISGDSWDFWKQLLNLLIWSHCKNSLLRLLLLDVQLHVRIFWDIDLSSRPPKHRTMASFVVLDGWSKILWRQLLWAITKIPVAPPLFLNCRA